jgi:heptosyltransferase-2
MKKILVVKLAALGDVLATSPIFRLISEQDDAIEIHHLVMSDCLIATSNNPYISKHLTIPTFPTPNHLSNLKIIFRLFRMIKSEGYSVAFVLHRNLLFQLLLKFSGIPEIYGFNSNYNLFLKKAISYKTDVNRTLQEVSLIKLYFDHISNPDKLDFYVNKSDINEDLIRSLPDVYICCNPGGGNYHSSAKNRMWPIEKYAEVIDLVDIPFVILGNSESDFLLVDRLKFLTKRNFVNLVGKTNLNETSLIIKNGLLYLGNDSSLLYLSSAMKTKSIGLFGPTQVVAANPLGKYQDALVGMSECSPCYNPEHGAGGMMFRCKNNLCMQSIRVEDVVLMINEKIGLKIYENFTGK